MERKVNVYYYAGYNIHSYYDHQKIHEKIFDNIEIGIKWLNENDFVYHNHVFIWVKTALKL